MTHDKSERYRRRGVALAAALTLGLSACSSGGSSGDHSSSAAASSGSGGASSSSSSESSSPSSTQSLPSGQEAFTKVQSFVRNAKSVTLEVKGTISGKPAVYSSSGDLGNGPAKSHVTISNSGAADVVYIGSDVYVRGDTPFWTAFGHLPRNKATRIADRWFKGDHSTFGSSIDGMRPKVLVKEIDGGLGSLASAFRTNRATVTKTTYNQQDAYLTSGDDGRTKVWCSADGTFTPYQAEQPDHPEDFASATFKDWNHAPTVTAPAGATTLPQSGSGRA